MRDFRVSCLFAVCRWLALIQDLDIWRYGIRARGASVAGASLSARRLYVCKTLVCLVAALSRQGRNPLSGLAFQNPAWRQNCDLHIDYCWSFDTRANVSVKDHRCPFFRCQCCWVDVGFFSFRSRGGMWLQASSNYCCTELWLNCFMSSPPPRIFGIRRDITIPKPELHGCNC